MWRVTDRRGTYWYKKRSGTLKPASDKECYIVTDRTPPPMRGAYKGHKMEAAEIIEYLRQKDLTVTLADEDTIELSPAEKVTRELLDRLRKYKPAIIEELKRRDRYARVWQMLEDQPSIRRAFVTDTMSDRDNVILTLAIRGVGTCELEIPKRKYDPFLLLAIIERTAVQ